MSGQQGDVYLFQTPDNGDIEIEDGIVTTVGGLATAVYLSILGGNEDDDGLEQNLLTWWGNVDETEQDRKYISETQNLLKGLPAVSRNLILVEEAVKRDLKWMLDNKVASNIDVFASIPEVGKISIDVDIIAEGNRETFNFTENWQADYEGVGFQRVGGSPSEEITVTDYQYISDKDGEILGPFTTTDLFVWAKDSSGQFVKAARGDGAESGSTEFIASSPAATNLNDLTLNDFPDWEFTAVPAGDGFSREETSSPFPDRTVEVDGLRHTFPPGGVKAIRYDLLGANGAHTSEDFTVEAVLNTEDLNVNAAGQVQIRVGVYLDNGDRYLVGVWHRTSSGEPSPQQKYHAEFNEVETVLLGTSADYSGDIKAVRSGTNLTLSMDNGTYSQSYTIPADAKLDRLSLVLSSGNGSSRSDAWYVTTESLTISSP